MYGMARYRPLARFEIGGFWARIARWASETLFAQATIAACSQRV